MSMWLDLSLQGLMFIVGIGVYLWSNDVPRKLIQRYHDYRNRNKHQARLHFVKAAQLLNKARSHPPSSSQRLSLAALSAIEADSAVQLDPSDAANHIVRALALDLQGFKPSALEAIDVALSPLAEGSLSAEEKADALVKRAELRMEVSRSGGGGDDEVDQGVWSGVERELREAVKLNKESAKGWCLLGECCVGLGKTELGRDAFQEAIRIEPASLAANQALQRLDSTTTTTTTTTPVDALATNTN